MNKQLECFDLHLSDLVIMKLHMCAIKKLFMRDYEEKKKLVKRSLTNFKGKMMEMKE